MRPKKCFFVSDLHLFASRSNAHRYLEEIARSAARAETFVLGGDIFDFRWSRYPVARTADRAAEWLRELAAAGPECHFHLVLGNHDYHRTLISRLKSLEREVANLSWHRFYVRLGSSVFLHGDVADRKMDARKLAQARDRWLDDRRRGPLMRRAYDAVVSARLHRSVPRLVYARRLVVRRILAYLESVGEGPGSGVRDVYFGHTHRGMSNYRYRGLTFHNGGAPIKGVQFRILEARQ